MKLPIAAALAAMLCFAQSARADGRPTHDETIARAAIAILQKRLPELRRGLEIGERPALIREAVRLNEEQNVSALVETRSEPAEERRIRWP